MEDDSLSVERNTMKTFTITRVSNGYLITTQDGPYALFQDSNEMSTFSLEQALQCIAKALLAGDMAVYINIYAEASK